MLKPVERITPDSESLAAYNLVLAGNVAEGLAQLKRLIANDEHNPMLQFSIAYAYELSMDYKSALQYYSQAAKGHVQAAQILSNMSGCFICLRKYKKALEYSLHAVKLEPNTMAYRYNLALAYERLKKWSTAYEQYKLYLTTNEESIKGYRGAIRCCTKISNPQNFRDVSSTVEELCLKALKVRPGQSWIRGQLVKVYVMRFDFKGAFLAAFQR